MTDEKRALIDSKIKFVKALSDAITTPVRYDGNYALSAMPDVRDIEYVVFESNENSNWVSEHLVITFKGGARCVRCCSGNSYESILKEIGKYISGGYYDEVDNFEKYLTSDKWSRYVLKSEATFSALVNFLCNHQTAADNFSEFFKIDIFNVNIEDLATSLDRHEVASWISDREELAKDLLIHFNKVSPDATAQLHSVDIFEMVNDLLDSL